MAERTEKVRLVVEAPKGNLDSKSSGLSVALTKLGRINRMLKLVEQRYKRIISLQGKAGGTAGFFPEGASNGPLFNQGSRSGPRFPGARIKVGGGQGQLQVPASSIHATVAPGEFIRLKIPANQIVAAVTGGTVAAGGGGGGGGSKGGKGGGGGGKAGGIAITGALAIEKTKLGQETLKTMRVAHEAGKAIIETEKAVKGGARITQREINAGAAAERRRAMKRSLLGPAGNAAVRDPATGRVHKGGLAPDSALQQERDAKARAINARRRAAAQKKADAAQKKATKATQKATEQNQKFDESNRMIGRNMLTNIKHVTSWAAAVTVLYKTMALGKFAVRSFLETQFQTARLTQVFRHGSDGARRLADDVLKLAAANGRSADEALNSAIQWSRLGLTRAEAHEAVRVSLMAANVAEISAADATERLSALYATYGLKVFELNSVLGMLNSTSNRFNVTNKDLLDGITKTAAAASQAGINLAELIGIIGGTVGTTGQTGKEIGNAVKSLVGIFSNPEKQGLLRDTYDFETMAAATGEMKDMSDVLRDLFIHMQKLSDAESSSLIFNVAGRRQASRLKSIMQSYVQSQVLAIQAQLDLSSGMEENEKIVATLRSSFAGLVTEFERFVAVQGEGPAHGLNFFVKTLKSLLALMNGGIPGGQFITTAFLSVLAVAGARMAMVSLQMQKVGQNAGYVKTSLHAVKGAYIGMNRSLITATRMAGTMGIRMDNLARNIKKNGIAIKGTALSTASWTRFNLLAAASIRSLTVALSTLWSVAGPLIAFLAIGKGLQIFDEATTGYADAELNKLQQINQEMEALRNSADAAGRAVRLFDTAIETIKSGNVGTKQDVFDQLASASAFAEPGESEAEAKARERRIEAVQKEYTELLRMHREATTETERQRIENELIIRQERQKAEWLSKQARFRAQAFEKQAEEIVRLKDKIKAIDDGFFTGGITTESKRESRSKFENRIEQIRSAQIEGLLQERSDLDRDREAYFTRDVAGRGFAQARSRVTQSIADVFNEINGGTFIDKHELEIGKLTTIRDLYKHQLEALKAKRKEVVESSSAVRTEAEVTKDIRENAEKIVKTRKRIGLGEQRPADFADVYEDPINVEQERKKLAELRRKQDALLAEQALAQAPATKQFDNRIADTQKKIRQAEGNLAGAEAAREAIRQRNDVSIAAKIANAQIGNFGADQETEGEKIAARRSQLESFRNRNEVNAQFAGDEAEAQNSRIAALTAQQQLQDDMIRAQVRMVELQGEETEIIARKTREYQRALLTAGPAELLRKLAVAQLQNSGPGNAGQFFAFSGETRSTILELPQNTEEFRRNQREQAALRGAGVPENPNVRQLQERSAAGSQRTRTIVEGLNPDLDVQANVLPPAVEQAVNRFGAMINSVNRSLVAFQARIDATLPAAAGPVNPQIPA